VEGPDRGPQAVADGEMLKLVKIPMSPLRTCGVIEKCSYTHHRIQGANRQRSSAGASVMLARSGRDIHDRVPAGLPREAIGIRQHCRPRTSRFRNSAQGIALTTSLGLFLIPTAPPYLARIRQSPIPKFRMLRDAVQSNGRIIKKGTKSV